jgi:hypothetical protein
MLLVVFMPPPKQMLQVGTSNIYASTCNKESWNAPSRINRTIHIQDSVECSKAKQTPRIEEETLYALKLWYLKQNSSDVCQIIGRLAVAAFPDNM